MDLYGFDIFTSIFSHSKQDTLVILDAGQYTLNPPIFQTFCDLKYRKLLYG